MLIYLIKEAYEIQKMEIRHGEGDLRYKPVSITPVFPITEEMHLTNRPNDLNDEPNNRLPIKVYVAWKLLLPFSKAYDNVIKE